MAGGAGGLGSSAISILSLMTVGDNNLRGSPNDSIFISRAGATSPCSLSFSGGVAATGIVTTSASSACTQTSSTGSRGGSLPSFSASDRVGDVFGDERVVLCSGTGDQCGSGVSGASGGKLDMSLATAVDVISENVTSSCIEGGVRTSSSGNTSDSGVATKGGEADASRRSYLAIASDALAARRATLNAVANELRRGVGECTLGDSGEGGGGGDDAAAKADRVGDDVAGGRRSRLAGLSS
jgi:hypothetical protein